MPCMNDLPLAIAVSYMSFLKPDEKQKLWKTVESIKELALLSISDISKIIGRVFRKCEWFPEEIEKQVAYALKIMKAYNIKSCLQNDVDYPSLLKEIFDPPFMLFWRGNIRCLNRKCAAIVGTRHASALGLKASFEISKALVEKSITVVSGLALGIDGAAHKGAVAARLPAEKQKAGATCAVLACGIESIYPASHRKLGGIILEKGGCILSEYPPGWYPQKWCFPARNRIISGLSSITAVIEAPRGSGALITADFAIEQGRELAFHACGVKHTAVELTESKKMDINQYVNDGAPVINNADELIALMRAVPDMRKSAEKQLMLFDKE